MNRVYDEMVVVDSQARVIGVTRDLRVVDASTFLFLPPGSLKLQFVSSMSSGLHGDDVLLIIKEAFAKRISTGSLPQESWLHV